MTKREKVNTVALVVAVCILLLVVVAPVTGTGISPDANVTEAASESQDSQTLRTSTTWNPGDFLMVSIDYSVNAAITPGDASSGERSSWTVGLNNGRIGLDGSVSLGPVESDFSQTFDLSLGDSAGIPLPNTGGQVIVNPEINAVVQDLRVTEGSAQVPTSEVRFDSGGTKQFDVVVPEEMSSGEPIQVTATVVPTINLGLEETVPVVGPGEIAQQEVGAPPFEPQIRASTQVGANEGTSTGVLPILILTLIIVAGVVYFYTQRREQSTTDSEAPDPWN